MRLRNIIPELSEALGKTDGPRVIENKDFPDLTQSPIPRFDLLHFSDYWQLGIQTSRGCPFQCEFCDVPSHQGRSMRYKKPQQMIRELDALLALGARGDVFFCDDNFVGSKKSAQTLLEALVEWMVNNGYPFRLGTQTTLNLGQDEEIMRLMAAANFSYVHVGIESPDEDVLIKMNKQHNLGRPIVECLENIKRNGIAVIGSVIMGCDGEKSGHDERICSFVESTGIPVVWPHLLTALPQTKLFDRLKEEGRLLEERRIQSYWYLNYMPTRPTEEILAEFSNTWDYLYDPPRYLARAYEYFVSLQIREDVQEIRKQAKQLLAAQSKPTKRRSRYSTLRAFRASGLESGN